MITDAEEKKEKIKNQTLVLRAFHGVIHVTSAKMSLTKESHMDIPGLKRQIYNPPTLVAPQGTSQGMWRRVTPSSTSMWSVSGLMC